MEGIVWLERENYSTEELYDFFYIVEMCRFYYGMHAAEWDGDEGTWHAVFDREDGVCVRACEAAAGFMLKRDFFRRGYFHDAFDQQWVIGSAVTYGRACS